MVAYGTGQHTVASKPFEDNNVKPQQKWCHCRRRGLAPESVGPKPRQAQRPRRLKLALIQAGKGQQQGPLLLELRPQRCAVQWFVV